MHSKVSSPLAISIQLRNARLTALCTLHSFLPLKVVLRNSCRSTVTWAHQMKNKIPVKMSRIEFFFYLQDKGNRKKISIFIAIFCPWGYLRCYLKRAISSHHPQLFFSRSYHCSNGLEPNLLLFIKRHLLCSFLLRYDECAVLTIHDFSPLLRNMWKIPFFTTSCLFDLCRQQAVWKVWCSLVMWAQVNRG